MKKRTLVALLALLAAGAGIGSAGQGGRPGDPDLRAQNPLVLLVFGDSGTGEAGQRRVGEAMAATCRARGCHLGLLLGDALYSNGLEVKTQSDAARSRDELLEQLRRKFEQPYASLRDIPGFRIWVALGNHDYRSGSVSALFDYSQVSGLWRLPAYHYDVPGLPDWLQLRAVHTDTDERRDLNGLQVEVLRSALCTERTVPRWKLVFGHHPLYSSGQHGGDGNERRVRAMLEPLLRECGVHAYFAGHDHHQEHLSAPGFEQIVQGAAAKTRDANRPRRSAPARQRHYSGTFGFAIVDLRPDTLRADFYDVRNTREGGAFTPPRPDEIVLRYSWCGRREDAGHPETDAPGCSAGGEPTRLGAPRGDRASR
jgi:tartrate-resistant acid phosphatase type 5